MGLVRIGPVTINVDDIRAIRERESRTVEVTFRDGSTMDFDGQAADALKRFVLNLPDGIPLMGANDAAMGVVGRRDDLAAMKRQEG